MFKQKFPLVLSLFLILQASLHAASLTWTGTNGSSWDINSTVNWNNAGSADVFFNGDAVTFNDTSSNGSVVLSGTLQPGSVTANNSAIAYDLSGAGQISGTASLLKAGSGTLTISTGNTYTGSTTIRAGTVILANATGLSTSGSTTLGDASTGGSNISLLMSPTSSAFTFARPISVSSSGSGTVTIGRTGTGTGMVTLSSTVTLNRSATFQSAPSGTLSITGTLRGAGNATFDGGGVTSISSASGTTTLWTGNALVRGNSMLLATG